VILGVLDAISRRLEEAGQTRRLPVKPLRDLLKFSRIFIDKCHHGKEERCLFPCLEKLGVPREGGPIGVMLQEHEIGRNLVKRISEMLDLYEKGAATIEDVLDPCQFYVELLTQHIQKENNILFPMGDNLMTEENHRENMTCYERKEEEIGHEEHRRLVSLAETISRE